MTHARTRRGCLQGGMAWHLGTLLQSGSIGSSWPWVSGLAGKPVNVRRRKLGWPPRLLPPTNRIVKVLMSLGRYPHGREWGWW